MHPNRKDVITHEQARKSLQRFVNLHFHNVGEKSRASIPAHQDDDDILLSDYISQQELGPGLGSGALREAVEKFIHWQQRQHGRRNWPTEDVVELEKLLLSLSSPIEFDEAADARRFMREIFDVDMPEHSLNETIAACASKRFWKGREVESGTQPTSQASSEIREARTVGCTASDDCVHECPVSEPESRLDEFKTTVIALWDPELTPEQKKAYIASRGKELRDAAALAPSRQGAAKRVEG